MQDIKKSVQGLIYFWQWNCSMFGGYLLFVPLTFLQILTPKLHRGIVDFVVTYWQYYVTTLLIRQNCHVHVTGDAIKADEVSLVISNHRTRVDWNFLWPIMYHAVEGKNRWWLNTKFVLKNSIKNIPVAGWVMQMAMYIFINRNWTEDKILLDDYVEYVADMDYKHILILFPEGTDLTPRTKKLSDRYANDNKLQEYNNVLHPRWTGFVHLVDEMRSKKCLDAVYDLTLIYPDECPQNEEDLFLRGKIPKNVTAHLVRYPVSVLPLTPDGLREFLARRWLEKEKTIEEFKRTGHFLHHGKVLDRSEYLTHAWAYFTHLVWVAGTCGLVYLLLVNMTYACLVVAHAASLYIIPRFTNASLFKIKKNAWRLLKGGGIKRKTY